MAEITRQHLEDAARAAGKNVVMTPIGRDTFDALDVTKLTAWRPHLDDGDALRLAANVGMRITLPRHCGDGVSTETPDGKWSCTVYRDNKPAQMRVAIVLCAAEVGKRMREGGQ